MKFVVLTDSTGCPRIFPKSERVDLEDTYPYLLRKEFDTSKFWQLSIGNQISKLLIDNARGYLTNWHPNYIIVGTGINDARPEFLSEKITKNLNFEGKLSFFNKFIKRLYLSPFLIKLFNNHRVSEEQFLKSIISLKNTFKTSKIIWLEIYCHNNYDRDRPGVLKRKNSFNEKIKKILGNDFLEISEEISNNDFYTKDFHHFTKQGHYLIAKKIIEHIKKRQENN